MTLLNICGLPAQIPDYQIVRYNTWVLFYVANNTPSPHLLGFQCSHSLLHPLGHSASWSQQLPHMVCSGHFFSSNWQGDTRQIIASGPQVRLCRVGHLIPQSTENGIEGGWCWKGKDCCGIWLKDRKCDEALLWIQLPGQGADDVTDFPL